MAIGPVQLLVLGLRAPRSSRARSSTNSNGSVKTKRFV